MESTPKKDAFEVSLKCNLSLDRTASTTGIAPKQSFSIFHDSLRKMPSSVLCINRNHEIIASTAICTPSLVVLKFLNELLCCVEEKKVYLFYFFSYRYFFNQIISLILLFVTIHYYRKWEALQQRLYFITTTFAVCKKQVSEFLPTIPATKSDFIYDEDFFSNRKEIVIKNRVESFSNLDGQLLQGDEDDGESKAKRGSLFGFAKSIVGSKAKRISFRHKPVLFDDTSSGNGKDGNATATSGNGREPRKPVSPDNVSVNSNASPEQQQKQQQQQLDQPPPSSPTARALLKTLFSPRSSGSGSQKLDNMTAATSTSISNPPQAVFVSKHPLNDETKSSSSSSKTSTKANIAESSVANMVNNDNSKSTVSAPVPVPMSVPVPEDLFDASKFYSFEFPDITTTARGMYIDRSYSHSFKLRGPAYLTDQKKIDPGPAMCKLMLMELYEVNVNKDSNGRHDHIAARGLAKQRVEAIRALPGSPFVFVVNFQIPGDPPISVTNYFALPPDLKERFPGDATENFLKLFEQYIDLPKSEAERRRLWGLSTSNSPTTGHNDDASSNGYVNEAMSELSTGSGQSPSTTQNSSGGGSMWGFKMPSDVTWADGTGPGEFPLTDFRNCRFKLVPLVTDGPWAVKAAVRPVPAILGKKVVQRYFHGDGYIETDVHVGSSLVASQIVGVCRGYAKNFAADVGIVIQGEREEELPERFVGCVSINRIDVDNRRKLD